MGKESPQTENYQSKSARTRWQNPEYVAMQRARRPSPSQIEAIKLSNSTRVISDETRKKISDANLRRLENPEYIAKMSGRKHSEKSKKKMSQSHKKNWADPEYKARVSAAVVSAKMEREKSARELKSRPDAAVYPLTQMLVDRLELEKIDDMPTSGRLISKAAIVIDSLDFKKLSLLERKSLMAYIVWTQNNGSYSPIIDFLGETKEGVRSMLSLVQSDDSLVDAFEKSEALFEAVTAITPKKRPSVVSSTIGDINSLIQEGKTLSQAVGLIKSSN
jgi:hypothetical protein